MIRLRVLSAWKGEGTGLNPYRPALVDDVPGLFWRDATAQATHRGLPTPAVLVVEVDAEPADLAAIHAHPNYGAAAVVWREDEPAKQVRPADRAVLATKLRAMGVAADEVAAVHSGAGDRTSLEANVRTWLKGREKR